MAARHQKGRERGPVGNARVARKTTAVAELLLGVAQCFFRIRAMGQRTGLVTGWGGGAFGFMRSLAQHGALTVPQIAQMRPTSRQRMQRLADELVAAGLAEFVANPKHRRSRLVRLTRKGEARYRSMTARLLAVASTMGGGLTETEIKHAADVVQLISDEITDAESRSVEGEAAHSPRRRHRVPIP